ncbi:glycoside hydrolase family 3 C-terminal domain-containing protein [bacterium]|nr:glycoside hydrolase family 3 C-terminal domain-containing protein [bacterium]
MTDAHGLKHAPYRNGSLPVGDRVDDLLGRMTLEEKAAQVQCMWQMKAGFCGKDGMFMASKAGRYLRNGLGVIARPSEIMPQGSGANPDPEKTAAICNALQKYALEKTRLGIPFLFHEEGLHGQQARGATMFPQAIAMAGTFDPDLVERIYAAVAREIRARGAHHALTPVIDVARDPRWGRTEETFGEDPYLVSEMGKAAVWGFQGRTAKIGPERVAATAKHFAVHGQPQGGTNCAPGNYSDRDIRDFFLKPFREAVITARIRAVMPSYNEVDGVPSHMNTWLLRDILRQEWGFDGIVVGDYFAVAQLVSLHHTAADKREAAKRALEAGVDIETPDPDCYATVCDQVRRGRIAESVLDRAVRRILRLKFEMGLFENPFVDVKKAGAVVNCKAHRDLAYEAACRAGVLLQNRKNRLPLDASAYRTIAVIGPNAADIHLGGYSDEPRQGVPVLEGLKRKLGNKVKLAYAEGCRLNEGEVSWFRDEVIPPDEEKNRARIREAVETARNADCIILAIGGNEATCREGWADNHLGDRPSLELASAQNDLVDALAVLKKPMIAVLINGRPLAVQNVLEKCDAVLECWYLGQETGRAVADMLFGDVNPGGKLPVTFPRSAGHIPAFYNKKPSANRGYLFAEHTPLFPFGFGLSYTRFKIGRVTLADRTIGCQGRTTVSAEVTNTGRRAGDEVVQMYIRDRVSSVTRPVKELKGFRRIHLGPGESQIVHFDITPEHLAFTDIDMNFTVEPGEFDIMIGSSSDDRDLRKIVLTVTSQGAKAASVQAP